MPKYKNAQVKQQMLKIKCSKNRWICLGAKMLRTTNGQIKQQMRKRKKCPQTCKNAYGQQMPKLSTNAHKQVGMWRLVILPIE
jgi:hypothetical protein